MTVTSASARRQVIGFSPLNPENNGGVMSQEDREDTTIYKVVVNHEEQYSIWPADRENPLGWKDEGTVGSKDVCLAQIENIWTDMRPLSLRRKMAEIDKESES
jgi:MbtH protein